MVTALKRDSHFQWEIQMKMEISKPEFRRNERLRIFNFLKIKMQIFLLEATAQP